MIEIRVHSEYKILKVLQAAALAVIIIKSCIRYLGQWPLVCLSPLGSWMICLLRLKCETSHTNEGLDCTASLLGGPSHTRDQVFHYNFCLTRNAQGLVCIIHTSNLNLSRKASLCMRGFSVIHAVNSQAALLSSPRPSPQVAQWEGRYLAFRRLKFELSCSQQVMGSTGLKPNNEAGHLSSS